MKISFSILFFVVSVLIAGTVSAQPSKSLLEAAKAEEQMVLDSLRTLVSMESGTMDSRGLIRIADYLEERLTKLGARVERHKVKGVNGDVLVS